MNSKKIIIILGIILVIILIGITLLVRSLKNDSNSRLQPTSTISPTPTTIIIQDINTINPTMVKELQLEQSKADYEYAKVQEKRYQDYPWYDKLPIGNDTYFVYFSSEDKKFIGKIYDTAQTEQIKADVPNQLKELGVDVTTYPIIWE